MTLALIALVTGTLALAGVLVWVEVSSAVDAEGRHAVRLVVWAVCGLWLWILVATQEPQWLLRQPW